MEITEIEKLLESKKYNLKLDILEIRDLKIKLDIKKYPNRICHECGDGFGYADIKVCSNCN